MEYLWAVGVTAIVTAVASWFVLRFARRRQLVHQPRERDMHQDAVPRLGGVAMFIGLLAGFGGALLLPRFQNLWQVPSQMWALFAACTLIAIIGTVDDLFDLCLLYTSPSPRDKRQSRMPSSA